MDIDSYRSNVGIDLSCLGADAVGCSRFPSSTCSPSSQSQSSEAGDDDLDISLEELPSRNPISHQEPPRDGNLIQQQSPSSDSSTPHESPTTESCAIYETPGTHHDTV